MNTSFRVIKRSLQREAALFQARPSTFSQTSSLPTIFCHTTARSSPLLASRTYSTAPTEEAPKEAAAGAEQTAEKTTKEEGPEANEPKTITESELKAALAEKEKQIAGLQDVYRCALADAENVRQRTRKEVADTKEYAITKFAKDLLSVADVLDLALKAVPQEQLEENAALKNLYTGVDMTRSNLQATFKRFSIEVFNPQGEVFDPNFHEALFQAPIPDKEPNTVFEVAKIGYKLGNRCLRPAQVGVVQARE